MIVRDGLVKITDFGIARMRTAEVKTMTGMILGSPKYMSPEQVAGKRADHRSDIFSLGVLLYEMVAGQAPFQGDSIHGVMYQILNSAPPRPSLRRPELPEIVDLIVAKALAKNVDERYQSAKDMARDLKDCKDMLLGRTGRPPRSSGDTAAEPAASNATRGQDQAIAIKPADLKAVDEPEKPVMTLSSAFDSYEATMRLAAMTGMDKELRAFTETRAGKAGTADTAALRNAGEDASGRGAGAKTGGRGIHTYLWIASAVASIAAAALFVVHLVR